MHMHRRGSRIGKAVMILVFCTAFIAAFSFIVMSLWNAILPAVLGIKTITFWQAMGILVLSKILFGGFGGWGHKKEQFRNKWKQRMQEKWSGMTPEERQKFKEQWKARCGGWGGRFNEENFKTNEPGTE
jgi:Ca2+/H+ antiporter, TMEM165/GDT1 family